MSTLLVVEEVLRERGIPMVVREIVEVAAERLPTKSKTPDTVVARDLAMDIKKHGTESRFARVAPGRYTLRELALAMGARDSMESMGELSVSPAASSAPIQIGQLGQLADGAEGGDSRDSQPVGAVGDVMVQHQLDGSATHPRSEVSYSGS